MCRGQPWWVSGMLVNGPRNLCLFVRLLLALPVCLSPPDPPRLSVSWPSQSPCRCLPGRTRQKLAQLRGNPVGPWRPVDGAFQAGFQDLPLCFSNSPWSSFPDLEQSFLVCR